MFEQIIGEAIRTPWTMSRSYLAVMQRILGSRVSGGRPLADDLTLLRAAREVADAQRQAELQRTAQRLGGQFSAMDDEDDVPPSQRMMVFRSAGSGGGATRGTSIAVIPIYGVILHRSFDAISGATSCDMLNEMIRRATDDDEIGGAVLDIASPGGSVVGVPETADRILAMRKKKSVTALVNGEMHSAAYWLGSQANQIVSIPSGYCGSIGVWMMSEDYSEYLANEGIKINFIFSGDNKIEDGRFWEPLSEETRAYLEAECARVHAQFRGAVAKGRSDGDRRVTAADVKKDYGEGRVFNAPAALKLGMIDSLGSMEDVLRSMLKTATRRQAGLAAEASPAVPALSDETPALFAADVADEVPAVDPVPAMTAADAQLQADIDAAAAAVAIAERL